MCGDHSHDGTPIGHSHGRSRRIFYPAGHPLRAPLARTRRAFLGDLGKGTVAMAVLSPMVLAACSSDGGSESTATIDPTAAPDPTAVSDPTAASEPTVASDPTAAPDPTAAADPTSASESEEAEASEASGGLEPVSWARVNLGFVSAYVLVRGNTAAIVDTGVAGSAEAIGQTLVDLGLTYNDVDHVILTHSHSDHAGSIGAVLDQAVNATGYVGEADLGAISADLTALAGGEDIFGFEMLSTPGHTAGHMAVIDHAAGLLVAGDALFTEDGGVIEGPERFFDDIPQSRETIARLGELSYETLLVGHGEPIEGGADTAVAALAASF